MFRIVVHFFQINPNLKRCMQNIPFTILIFQENLYAEHNFACNYKNHPPLMILYQINQVLCIYLFNSCCYACMGFPAHSQRDQGLYIQMMWTDPCTTIYFPDMGTNFLSLSVWKCVLYLGPRSFIWLEVIVQRQL